MNQPLDPVRLTRCLAIMAIAGSMASPAWPCTTAVVSGRATADGRPLLWKNRDTDARDNRVVCITGGRYSGVAVISAGSTRSIAMGVNEVGFCIENSLSRDLDGGNTEGMANGEFMKLALESCATVDDFQQLLERTNARGRRTRGNFGVIDAQGGAGIFEAGHHSFEKFDANDPAVAPDGYVVRSNFSMTATGKQRLALPEGLTGVYSAERYARADALLAPLARDRRLDHRYILRHCCRDLADADGQPYCSTINGAEGPLPAVIDTTSTICRRTTVSAAVFHGVKPGEDPLLTTMWVMLGDPAFSIAVPCWVRAGGVAAELEGRQRSPLCSLAIRFRDANYDQQQLQTDRLQNIWSQCWTVEDALFDQADRLIDRWRGRPPEAEAVLSAHRRAARTAMQTLSEALKGTLPLGAAGQQQ